ncbi:MAG TPA: VWA domain-containing protein [Planctomycetota bacterium]|nr:VWA domain-containing protein [Planctomycetota bacterium]
MFLNSLLIYGTALGAVPIIIHLLNKRRFRPVTWAAMEFLMNAIQKNARRLQLRDIILMLIRAAAIMSLAMALARPAVSAKGFLGSGMKTGAIILLDNSLSMGYNNGREMRFEGAKRLSKQVISQLEAGSWCGLFTFSDEVKMPLGEPSPDLNYMEQEVDRSVLLSDGGTNIEKALQRVKKVFETHREYQTANRELYIITDMQSRPWNDVSSSFKTLVKEISATAVVYLINAGDAGSENVSIIDLAATDTLAAVETPISFVVKIKNFGSTDIQGLPVDFYIDPTGNNDKANERATVTVASRETASVTFEAKFNKGGDHKVEVRIADDRLMGDNRRYATVEVVEDSRILLVDGREAGNEDPIASETGFLKFAISPVDPENPTKQSAVVTETVAQQRFSDRNLLNYQTVVLANVSSLPQSALTVLEKQVRGGMGLMVFLGDQSDGVVMNGLLGENGPKLLPAKIGAIWGEAPIPGEKMPQAHTFATDKLSHPIMSDFNSSDFAELLSATKVYRGYDLEVPQDDLVSVVAWLSNGKPAVVEKKVGSGFVLLFAFPPTTAWGNLPTQPTFPIMMQRAVNRLTLGNRAPKNVPVTLPIHGIVSAADQNTVVRITPPQPAQKKETRPELTTDGRAAFDFADTDKAGFYDIVLDRTPKVSMTYALNPNTEIESNLDVVMPATLKTNFPDFDFSYVAKTEDFARALASERRGTELWPWLIGLVFVLLALESVLANRWAPRD